MFRNMQEVQLKIITHSPTSRKSHTLDYDLLPITPREDHTLCFDREVLKRGVCCANYYRIEHNYHSQLIKSTTDDCNQVIASPITIKR